MQQCNRCANQTCEFHAAENRKTNRVVHRDVPPEMFKGVDMTGRCANHVPLPHFGRTFLEAALSSKPESANATVALLRQFCLVKAFQRELVQLSE